MLEVAGETAETEVCIGNGDIKLKALCDPDSYPPSDKEKEEINSSDRPWEARFSAAGSRGRPQEAQAHFTP